MAALQLYNSLTRQLEPFAGPRDGDAVRIYTCGPTVYAYQHIGNMRAFLFADTLGRVLRWNGFKTKHIVNITDVGHLTSDADAGDDKMERAAAAQQKSIWDIAAHYTEAFKADVARLNIAPPAEWTVATDHIPQMIAFAQAIEKDCYRIESGLYFDTSRVPNYGALARQVSDDGESRIDPVTGKRHPQDFAIWRTSPPGEQRQMEWDSPWGKGAPGWHLECSVMSLQHLGHPFDIHTGGIDHREIHHPNEIAQNQAHCGCADTGAAVWMHNNFLIDRRGKMSKSSGDFLTLQTLVDRGVHPLAYRLMCLQAHYRSELEFTWEGLGAALTRLKRLTRAVGKLEGMERSQAAGISVEDSRRRNIRLGYRYASDHRWTVSQSRIRIENHLQEGARDYLSEFSEALSDDLNTSRALPILEQAIADKRLEPIERLAIVASTDLATGLNLLPTPTHRLRRRPSWGKISKAAVANLLLQRQSAKQARDFEAADKLRFQLSNYGIEVMDGDPLGWDWKLDL